MIASNIRRDLVGGGIPDVRHKYVHMLPKDRATWTMFLEMDLIDLDEVFYDVHVGRPMIIPEGSPEYMLRVVQGVSCKRIDVVARTGKFYRIIEVKPHANMESVGQVITYKRLFEEEYNIDGPVLPVIVSQTCDADIIATAEEQGVKLYPMMGVLL